MDKEDFELIVRSRNGNREAFSELILKHRAKAVNWAKTVTNDLDLAEDVAQEALLRSYLKLEALDHPDRFLPWLRTIVRNKAFDAIRAQKRLSLQEWPAENELALESDWPEPALLNKEWMTSLYGLLESLSERNRHIVVAHFLGQQCPEDIAATFHMTTANVYNILSRSKLKLQEERYRRETARYLNNRATSGSSASRVLAPPSYHSAYTSLGHVLHAVLSERMGLSDVMGLSGQAFRIQMTVDCGLSSSLIYDWGWVMERTAASLGYRTKWLGRPGKVLTPDQLTRTIDLIHQTIDRGSPLIVWNLARAEFGILCGYNDNTCRFTYRNASAHSLEVSYEKLGRTLEYPELFVASLEDTGLVKQVPRLMFKNTLETIIGHARSREPDVPGYIKGIAAYDAWIEAIEADRVQPVGHAYQVTLLTEAREHAVAFLTKWKDHPVIQNNMQVAVLWQEAISGYHEVHRTLLRMYPSFPYGMPNVKVDIRERSIRALEAAKKAEEQGIARLEEIFWLLFPHV